MYSHVSHMFKRGAAQPDTPMNLPDTDVPRARQNHFPHFSSAPTTTTTTATTPKPLPVTPLALFPWVSLIRAKVSAAAKHGVGDETGMTCRNIHGKTAWVRMMAGVIDNMAPKFVSVHANITPLAMLRSRLSLVYVLPLDFVTHAEISENVISDCGLLDFTIDEASTGKNGEGICEYHDYDSSYSSNIARLGSDAANVVETYTGVTRGNLQ